MTRRTLLCCLEERSAKEMLKVVLPKLLPEGWAIQFVVFEGKTDLLKRLGFRLQHWQGADTSVLVLCDQDAQDCRSLKRDIRSIVAAAGYLAASKIRIACHELENFYLGDLLAVERGLSVKGLVKLSGKMPYRMATATYQQKSDSMGADSFWPPLMSAAETGDLSRCKQLVSEGADINCFVMEDEASAVTVALENGHEDVFFWLLDRGVELEHEQYCCDVCGMTYEITKEMLLESAITGGCVNAIVSKPV